MLQMNQVDQIKELEREGYGPTEIAKRLRVDRKTVSHYMKQEDFNASFEVVKGEASKLHPFLIILFNNYFAFYASPAMLELF